MFRDGISRVLVVPPASTTRLPLVLPGASRTTCYGFENDHEGLVRLFFFARCSSDVTYPVLYFDCFSCPGEFLSAFDFAVKPTLLGAFSGPPR